MGHPKVLLPLSVPEFGQDDSVPPVLALHFPPLLSGLASRMWQWAEGEQPLHEPLALMVMGFNWPYNCLWMSAKQNLKRTCMITMRMTLIWKTLMLRTQLQFFSNINFF